MSGGLFGDDVNAIVLDVGSFSTKAGFAGSDRPEIDIPSNLGFRETGHFLSSDPKYPSYLCGTNHIHALNENMEIMNPIKDGFVNNWSAYEALINHVLFHELHVSPDEHPILITEQPWSSSTQREAIAEIMFEKFGVTALYIAKSPVLSTFAHNKSTALVIDSGHTFTTVTPVVEGYALKKSSIHIPLAGSFILNNTLNMLKTIGINIIPPYMVAKKETSPESAPPIYTPRHNIRVKDSWHDFMIKNVIRDYASTVLQVSDTPLGNNAHLTPSYYEFPNGYYRCFNNERYSIPELLFNPSSYSNPQIPLLGIHNIAINSVFSCDIDVRSQLLTNIAVVGGNSLLSGYVDRLQHEIAASLAPNVKYKIMPASFPGDVRYSTWVGGSILASLGTFHQLWVSKSEYIENGKRSVDNKCS